MRHKLVARMTTLAAATTIAISTTCVTAYAVPATTLELNTGGDAASLQLLLSKEQRSQLVSALGDSLPDNGDTVLVSLDAKRLEVASVTLPGAVTAAEPLLVGKLSLSSKQGSGKQVAITSLDEPVQLTVMLPAELDGGSYHVASLAGNGYTSAADLDTVPNTVTFVVTSMDRFVVTRNEAATTKPTATPPAQPVQPQAPVGSNPTAGGVPDSYAPRTVLAQAVPISMPVAPMAPEQSDLSSHMAATSMMMTAAFVSGTIDYENSQHEEQPEQEHAVADTTTEDIFDEDAEDGIEDELEGFRETSYR